MHSMQQHKYTTSHGSLLPILRPRCVLASATRPSRRLQSSERRQLICQASVLRPSEIEATNTTASSTPSGSTSVERVSESTSPVVHFKKLLGKVSKAAAVGALCLALAFSAVSPALAARSGGYMGGSSFGSRGSSMGSSMGSRGMGGSLGGVSGMGGSSRNYGLSSPGMSVRRAPSVSINSFGWFGPPSYYGGGYGYGAPVANGGGGFGNVLLLGVLAAILWTAFSNFTGDSAGGEYAGERVTVAKLQVGLLGSARQIKRDLERIADRANTDSPSGLHYILQETVLALLRNPDYCVYGAATTSNKRGLEAGESAFNKLSMEERSKFKQETLVNVGGRRKSGRYSSGSAASNGTNELIVVTVLAAVEGGVKLPNVSSLEELRSALNKLGSIGKDQTLAVEVLWTPQDDDDYYTRDDIFQDYPTLNNL